MTKERAHEVWKNCKESGGCFSCSERDKLDCDIIYYAMGKTVPCEYSERSLVVQLIQRGVINDN